LIITCPGCQTRYRVDAKALAKPGGRTVRCAACGRSWHHPPTPLIGAREPAKADPLPEPTLAAAPRQELEIPAAPPPLEPTLAAPPHPDPPHAASGTSAPASDRPWASLLAAAEGTGAGEPPGMRPADAALHRSRWLTVGLPMLVVLIVVLAALYLARP
jgi:predicted Zn finger-like uncharacterized protein